jgi:hypothetical protein
MNKLLGSLLRDGLAVAAGNQIRKSIRRMGGLVAYYGVVAVFALAALAFLYVLIYDWLAQRLDPLSAAGILFAGNLLVAIVMIVARRLSKPRPSLNVQVPVVNGAVAGQAMEAGVALGREMRERLRRATPQIVAGAAVLGLIVGVRPQLIGLGRKRPSSSDAVKPGKRR